MRGSLPNLIVIGAMKAGTTSLHHYLSLHPDVMMSREKELDFFIEDKNWHRGVDWYRAQFASDAAIRGESSPNYTVYPRITGVPERMHAVVPGARLIYVLRDPIERMLSHYVHSYADRREDRRFADALTDPPDNRYVAGSRYHMQLQQYPQWFPRAAILVITQEDLYWRRRETMREVFGFLGVDDRFDSWRFRSVRHRSKYKRRQTQFGTALAERVGDRALARLPPEVRWHAKKLLYWPFSTAVSRPSVTPEVRRRLADAVRADIAQLRTCVGRDFPDWTI